MFEIIIFLVFIIIGKEIFCFFIVVFYIILEIYLGYGKLVKLINMIKKKFFLIIM